MRILVLTTSFPSIAYPVSGIFIQSLLVKLPSDFRVTVLTPGSDRKTVGQISFSSIKCEYLKYAPLRWQYLTQRPGGIPSAVSRGYWAWMLMPLLGLAMFKSAILRAHQVDLIHAHWVFSGLVAGLVGKIAGKPTITTLRGSDVRWAEKNSIFKKMIRWCVRLNTGIVTVSCGMKDQVKQWCPDFQMRIVHIPNGINSVFMARESSMELRHRITVVGNLVKSKGVDLVITAFASLAARNDQISLLIIGSGPELKHLQSLASRLQIETRVSFTGQLTQDKVADYLVQSEVLVSASYSEGLPNVILEAMAADVPVVASDIPGVRELVPHEERGLLFPVGDAGQLSECIEAIVDNPLLGRQLAEKAKCWLEEKQLTWEHAAQRYVKFYRQTLLNNKQDRPT